MKTIIKDINSITKHNLGLYYQGQFIESCGCYYIINNKYIVSSFGSGLLFSGINHFYKIIDPNNQLDKKDDLISVESNSGIDSNHEMVKEIDNLVIEGVDIKDLIKHLENNKTQ